MKYSKENVAFDNRLEFLLGCKKNPQPTLFPDHLLPLLLLNKQGLNLQAALFFY